MLKKQIAFVFLLTLIFALSGCSPEQKTFEILDAQKIVIISVDGNKVEITDSNAVQQITDNFNSIQFEKGKSSKNENGFGPIIQWYDSSGNLIESISVMGEQTIIYDEYFWSAADGRIDMEEFNELLEP